ncbi:MAG TPA: ABC transporter permease [Terriglobales bacterium]|nr:ABC transporter permease [Terriglobales bacterium]
MPRIASFFRLLFRRRTAERDLAAELAAFPELPADQIKDRTRDIWAGAWFHSVLRDLQYGARLLLRTPLVTALAVLVLALGVGANTALFSLVQGVVLAPLPYPNADRLAAVYMHFAPQNNPRGHLCLADFLAWRDANHSFNDIALLSMHTYALTGVANPVQEQGAQVTAGFFPALGVAPILGRALNPGDNLASSQRVAVIGAGLWQSVFRGDRNVVGEVVSLDGSPFTIVGVMPDSFHFPQPTSALWTNLRLVPPKRLGPYQFIAFGALRPGVTLAAARADLAGVAHRLSTAYPNSYRNLNMPVEDLRDALVGNTRTPLLVLLGVVGILLLLAVANVAGVLLSKTQTRRREMAIRASLGAGGARLVRQLLTESTLLAALGGCLGLAAAAAGLAWLRAANPANLPRMADVHLNGVVLAVTFALSLAAGILCGAWPAWWTLRCARQGGLASASRTRPGAAGSYLVAAEIALALMIVTTAGLLARSFVRLQTVDAGYSAPPDQIADSFVVLSGPAYNSLPNGDDSPAGLALDRALLDAVRALPGVSQAALSDAMPPFNEADDDTFTIRGQPWQANNFPSVPDASVSPGYFQTLGIPLLAGRDFTADDTPHSEPVIIISAAVARHHFPNQSPLGHFIKDAEPSLPGRYARIVGVVGDVKYQGLEGTGEGVYRPAQQDFDRFSHVIVRSSLPVGTLDAMIRRTVRRLDPNAILTVTARLDQRFSAGLAMPRFQTELVLSCAGLALLLASLGLYALIAFSVNQRRHEIGVRMALGASRGRVLAEVLAAAMRLALIGSAAGAVAAFLATRWLGTLLFHTSPTDAAVFLAGAATLLLAAAAASYFPARRASKIPPAIALRST